jgi:uncharacterized protein YbjT (DUF2867 family)
MKIAILGAAGMTGERLIGEALRRGHTVIGLARTPANIKGDPGRVERRFGDAFDRQSVLDGLQGADAVITTVGKRNLLDKRWWLNTEAHRNVIEGMRRHGARRLVAISSFGAARDMSRPGIRRKIYLTLRRKYYGDMQEMERMVIASGLEGVAVRAPMLYNTAPKRAFHVELDRNVPGGRSVSRDDLAAFVLDCVEKPDYVGRVVSLADERDAG